MAISDAMGMPPELWSAKVSEKYGKIKEFLDGDPKMRYLISINGKFYR